MKYLRLFVFAGLLACNAVAVANDGLNEASIANAEKLRDKAMQRTSAYDIVESQTN
jgi:hypothetical protein